MGIHRLNVNPARYSTFANCYSNLLQWPAPMIARHSHLLIMETALSYSIMEHVRFRHRPWAYSNEIPVLAFACLSMTVTCLSASSLSTPLLKN